MNLDAETIDALATKIVEKMSAGQGSTRIEEAMTSNDVMKLLGYKNRKQFWESVRASRVPFVRINPRRIIFQPAAIRAWMEKRTRNAA